MSKTRKIIGFIGLILAMFMGALDATIVNIALPDIMKDLKTGLTDTSWVATIYVLAMAAFIITASKLADIFGRKKIMLLGVIIFGGFSFACMTANSLKLLIVYRFFQGVGGAILTPIVLPMGIGLFGKANTSKITALMGAFSALAAAGGPAIGGLIINYQSYHWIFGINIPISLIAFLLILLGTNESYDESISKSVDWLGVIFLTGFMGSLCFGLLEGREYGWNSNIIVGCFIGSLISLILFIMVEAKAQSPIVNLNLFKEKTFSSSCIIYMVFGFAIIGPSLILNYFLQNVKNYSALHSAYLIIPASLAIVIGMPLATKMYRNISARMLIGIGLVVTAGGLAMLGMIKINTNQDIIVSCNIIIGIGLGFMAIALTSSVKYLPVEKTGIGSGVVNAARYVGQAIGMALLVTVLNNNVASAKNNIRETAYTQIHKRNLSPEVKKVAWQQISLVFKNSKSDNKINSKQKQMKIKIRQAAENTANLPMPEKGTAYRKLYLASQKLNHGTEKLGMLPVPQLKQSINALSKGQRKIGIAIKLLAQKQQLISALNKIQAKKNNELANACALVFILTSLLTIIWVPLCWFTDRKEASN